MIYNSVTSNIIADLEKGAVPWVKPWKGGNSGGVMPINAATHRYYTGINILILWSARDERGYPSPQWHTVVNLPQRRRRPPAPPW